MMKYRFIYLLGPEGAGKSTQATLLKRELITQGYKVIIVNMRLYSLPSDYFLRKFLVITNLVNTSLFSAALCGTWKVEIPKIIKRIYLLKIFLDFLSSILLALIKVYIPLIMGYTVIAEAYVIDICTDLQRGLLRLEKSSLTYALGNRLLNLLLRFIPHSSVIIFLDVQNYKELIRRYRKRKSIAEPKDYVLFRRAQLLKVMKKLGLQYFLINTETHNEKTVLMTILRNIK